MSLKAKRKKITVHREAYHRKPYTRKDGTKVKGSHVPATTYKTEDRGAPGRTPKSKQWFNPEGKLEGYHVSNTAKSRHAALLKTSREDGYATTIRRLNALRNVSTVRKVDQITKRDMEWLKNNREKI